ncbi:hypothetical protein [Streptomyces sp. 11-1-2]|uniref:hypothetical protein n=1 Tax=Streptomyces sp. 11-1-2 TaxID=1851167 RepID=UPI000B8D8E13|nr:hypothetical protein [Streptomyces sp. 11-1-2]ASR00801.1 hypothetical protein CGL27_48965 [Streptomyces sp. 11-1-2]ASR00833.1 hypothetical protein CGL27_49145 [Streptomyces sp. 11-1-2]
MTYAFYSDAAEKILRSDLSTGERTAVMSVRASLEEDPTPDHARGLPDADPRSESYAIELLPEQTGGRGITVVYRHDRDLDAVLILWIIAGP